MNDPNFVPEGISQLIDTFEAHLADVEFPGVTAAALREQAEAVDEAARTIAATEVALREARASHAEQYGALKEAATRGLGYARVYAADDESLRETLGGIELEPKRRRAPAKKTRARKPKKPPNNVAELPLPAETA